MMQVNWRMSWWVGIGHEPVEGSRIVVSNPPGMAWGQNIESNDGHRIICRERTAK